MAYKNGYRNTTFNTVVTLRSFSDAFRISISFLAYLPLPISILL